MGKLQAISTLLIRHCSSQNYYFFFSFFVSLLLVGVCVRRECCVCSSRNRWHHIVSCFCLVGAPSPSIVRGLFLWCGQIAHTSDECSQEIILLLLLMVWLSVRTEWLDDGQWFCWWSSHCVVKPIMRSRMKLEWIESRQHFGFAVNLETNLWITMRLDWPDSRPPSIGRCWGVDESHNLYSGEKFNGIGQTSVVFMGKS